MSDLSSGQGKTLPQLFPDFDQSVIDHLTANSHAMSLPKGTHVFSPGDPCRNFLLVLDGSVKVLQYSESGREIVLYRVQDGESCLLTTSCLLAEEDYSVSAITETDVTAIALPASAFNTALENSSEIRRFVFKNYSKRMAEFFVLIHELAFVSLDVRLSQKLLEHADDSGLVSLTHQQMAAELGSTREVISRRLKEFEGLGWIRLHRGKIELSDLQALQNNQGLTNR